VDLVGAGDAFAAGYLAASCRGGTPRDRLRLGHHLAAQVVTVRSDIAVDLNTEELPGGARLTTRTELQR
jgi:2-dehydro-3-deoxygluconokinase